MKKKEKRIRYRCDNPNCKIYGGGFFLKDEGSCPHCGSKEYHSFNSHPKHLKKIIDDLIKN